MLFNRLEISHSIEKTVGAHNNAHFGNQEIVRDCGVLRYFASNNYIKSWPFVNMT